jgi:hypothetical protein
MHSSTDCRRDIEPQIISCISIDVRCIRLAWFNSIKCLCWKRVRGDMSWFTRQFERCLCITLAMRKREISMSFGIMKT